MIQEKLNIKQYFQTLKIIHFALVAGLVLFAAAVSFITNNSKAIDDKDTINIYFIVVGLIGISGVFIGEFVMRRMLEQAKNKTSLGEKLRIYQMAKIAKYATLEGPALLSLVFFLLAQRPGFMVIAVFLILMLTMNYPTRERTITELGLSGDEAQMINQ